MIAETIKFALSNFTLTFFLIGLLFSAVAIVRAPKPVSNAVAVEKILSWFVFWTIGVAYFYNFVFHVFFGEMAAKFIGWADSPFQLEVGMASLGCSVVGFLAAFRSFDLRLAAILSPAIFMLGAAAGARPSDDSGKQLCARKCRHHVLERHIPSANGLRATLA